jgi:uroporphyrin-III C-methyltransferase
MLALAGRKRGFEFAGKRGGRPSTHQDDISNRLSSWRAPAIACCGSRAATLRIRPRRRGGAGARGAACPSGSSRRDRGTGGTDRGRHPGDVRGINRAVILAAGYGADDDGVDWAALARTGQPIVLYMAMRNLATIADELMRGGLPPARAAASSSPRPPPTSASSSPRSRAWQPTRSSISWARRRSSWSEIS